MKTISTTSLSKELGIPSKELFDKLVSLELIFRKNEKWHLTQKGVDVGGKMISNEKFGEFIAWPENFNPYNLEDFSKKDFLNATKIGEKFHISNQRVNNIFSELGWVEQAIKGWKITIAGRKLGGIQKEHQSGGTYVIWPNSILENNFFQKAITPTVFIKQDNTLSDQSVKKEPKYPNSLIKTKDGHLVRSRAELIIDNLLYDYGITHAYERELTTEEKVLSDFYIPARNGKDNKGKAVFIEFWGINDNDNYLERKKIKQEIYKKHSFNLIELDDTHIDNLDSHLRKAFLQFDINIE
jgi:hypothetical protein